MEAFGKQDNEVGRRKKIDRYIPSVWSLVKEEELFLANRGIIGILKLD